MSSNYFEVLGVRPILGRSLESTAPNERLGTAEAVLGYGLWQNHFGADPSIIGKIVHINLHPYTNCWCRPRGLPRLQERIAVRSMDTDWHGFADFGQ